MIISPVKISNGRIRVELGLWVKLHVQCAWVGAGSAYRTSFISATRRAHHIGLENRSIDLHYITADKKGQRVSAASIKIYKITFFRSAMCEWFCDEPFNSVD